MLFACGTKTLVRDTYHYSPHHHRRGEPFRKVVGPRCGGGHSRMPGRLKSGSSLPLAVNW